jgi:hypothetical protein
LRIAPSLFILIQRFLDRLWAKKPYLVNISAIRRPFPALVEGWNFSDFQKEEGKELAATA